MCGGEDEGPRRLCSVAAGDWLSLGDANVERLRSIVQSRTEPASRVEQARILLAYPEDPSFLRLAERSASITNRSAA